jgi:TldD protein
VIVIRLTCPDYIFLDLVQTKGNAMRRRDFVASSSAALAALSVSDRWVSSVIAGELDTPGPKGARNLLQVSRAEIDRLLAATLSKGADFADVFFEYRVTSSLSFEEDIVKSARRGIIQGVGIRAIKGDQVGFAFSEELTLERMLEAALAAASIAADNTARLKIKAISELRPKNLYPVPSLQPQPSSPANWSTSRRRTKPPRPIAQRSSE